MAESVNIPFEFGEEHRRLFARLENPEPALRDFGEYKRRRTLLSMKRLPAGVRSVAGLPPARRDGLFGQTLTYDVADGTKLTVGSADVRARILQEGGEIRPKNAKALAVPIHADAWGKRPRDFGDLVYVPRKGSGKAPLLIRKVVKGKAEKEVAFDLMFILLKKVTIKPHPYLFWDGADSNYLLTALQRDVEGGVK